PVLHHQHGGGRAQEEAAPPGGAGRGREGARGPARRAGTHRGGGGEEGMKGIADLVRLAREARERAHAPFSKFKVGAALRTREGEIVTGCNVENASYGLTLCAERVAVFKAVSEGLREFDAIAVVADAPRPTAPCG